MQDIGVSTQQFFDACLNGRNSRDINKVVYDRIIAMDDFQTFKKIMVKRNMELQLEAIKSLRMASKQKKKSSKLRDEEEEERKMIEAAIKQSMEADDEEDNELKLSPSEEVNFSLN